MSRSLSVLHQVCLNTARRMQSIPLLAARCEDTRFSQVLKKQWDDCCRINGEARRKMSWQGEAMPSLSEISRLSSQAGINLRTLTDRSVSHLAELRMRDGTESIAQITRALRQPGASADERELAGRLLRLEEVHMTQMKDFL